MGKKEDVTNQIKIHFSCHIYLVPALMITVSKFVATNTVKPVLETTCITRPPALRDHRSDTTILLISTQ